MSPDAWCGVTRAVTEKGNAGRICGANERAMRLESWPGKRKESIRVARQRKPAAVAMWALVKCLYRHGNRNLIKRWWKSWRERTRRKRDNQGMKKRERKILRNPRPGMVRSCRMMRCGGGT